MSAASHYSSTLLIAKDMNDVLDELSSCNLENSDVISPSNVLRFWILAWVSSAMAFLCTEKSCMELRGSPRAWQLDIWCCVLYVSPRHIAKRLVATTFYLQKVQFENFILPSDTCQMSYITHVPRDTYFWCDTSYQVATHSIISFLYEAEPSRTMHSKVWKESEIGKGMDSRE